VDGEGSEWDLGQRMVLLRHMHHLAVNGWGLQTKEDMRLTLLTVGDRIVPKKNGSRSIRGCKDLWGGGFDRGIREFFRVRGCGTAGFGENKTEKGGGCKGPWFNWTNWPLGLALNELRD